MKIWPFFSLPRGVLSQCQMSSSNDFLTLINGPGASNFNQPLNSWNVGAVKSLQVCQVCIEMCCDFISMSSSPQVTICHTYYNEVHFQRQCFQPGHIRVVSFCLLTFSVDFVFRTNSSNKDHWQKQGHVFCDNYGMLETTENF